LAFQDDDGGEEEAAGDDDHHHDGVAVCGLGCGWGGGGVVLALGAALCVEWRGKQERGEE